MGKVSENKIDGGTEMEKVLAALSHEVLRHSDCTEKIFHIGNKLKQLERKGNDVLPVVKEDPQDVIWDLWKHIIIFRNNNDILSATAYHLHDVIGS